jgi:porin
MMSVLKNPPATRKNRPVPYRILLVFACLLFAAHALAQEEPPEPECSEENIDACDPDTISKWVQWALVTGPDHVEKRLSINALPGNPLFESPRLDAWRARKALISKERGVDWSSEYVWAVMRATESLGEKTSVGGAFRTYGLWEAVGRGKQNSGALIWKLEHRHAWGSNVSPAEMSAEIGYLGLVHSTLSGDGLWLANLYWRQRFRDRKFILHGGWVDVGDYVDTFVLGDPWSNFFNATFQIGGGTMPVPAEGLGLAVGAHLAEKAYLIGGFVDANSNPNSPFDSIDDFFSDQEYFTHLELGWNTDKSNAFMRNAHITLWHIDERVDKDALDGWGFNLAWTWILNRHWTTFLRAGYSEDAGAGLEKSVSTGFAWSKTLGGNQLGVGLNWGEPSESTWGGGLPEQTTLEVYYRIQLFRELFITPDLQFVHNPALHPEQGSLWVLGLRARLAF